jgi:hypothetical protein
MNDRRTFLQLVVQASTPGGACAETPDMDIDSSPIVQAAQRTARRLLRTDRTRVAHVEGVALAAAHMSDGLPVGTAQSLVAAAWLHDIGHAPNLLRTGFHPLDGALHLAEQGWPDDIVRLVAHHSHAAVLAAHYGVADHLDLLAPLPGRAADILTFADLVAGTDGRGTTIQRRLADMRTRHEAGSPVPAAVREVRYSMLEQTALRVLRSSSLSRVDVRMAPA